MAENILLHTEHLSKKFGEQFILKDISLDVKKSDVSTALSRFLEEKWNWMGRIFPTAPSQEPPSASVSAWSSKAMTFSLT